MKTRTLLDGNEVEEFDKPVTLKVYTKCPEKYMLIDMQTGERYIGTRSSENHDWKKVDTCRTST
jgi:hypothetical protein